MTSTKLKNILELSCSANLLFFSISFNRQQFAKPLTTSQFFYMIKWWNDRKMIIFIQNAIAVDWEDFFPSVLQGHSRRLAGLLTGLMAVGSQGLGGGARPPGFCQSGNPILSTGGAGYAHHITINYSPHPRMIFRPSYSPAPWWPLGLSRLSDISWMSLKNSSFA